MDHENRRAYSPLYRGCALVVLLIFFFGGGWAVFSPAERAHAIGAYTREAISANLPEARKILGMLALDRDIEDFREYADRRDAAGNYYREEAGISLEMRPLRGRYEKAFASAYAALSGTIAVNAAIGLGPGKRKPPYIAGPEEVWFPLKSDLHLSHPYALDVFFQHVYKNGEAEKGPRIRTLYPGIVVAAASDWTGGQGAAEYRSGGLSPASGNGVVIYDPASRLYCSYFHLSSVAVRRGDVVVAGEILGRGGNSGMNARTAGHGEHVHIEIFDAARDGPLSSYEILELLKK
ncbi:MAG: M23 family metallopeptidase [Rectinemataceae bacterium]|jgi:murein DD-endopeptidase MepM/ murein hydrolase activator NlpD